MIEETLSRKEILRKIDSIKESLDKRIVELGACAGLYSKHQEINNLLEESISMLVVCIDILEIATKLI